MTNIQVVGLNTNLPFLINLASHPEFVAANVHTDFIPQHSKELFPLRKLSDATVCQAALAMLFWQAEKSQERALDTKGRLIVVFFLTHLMVHLHCSKSYVLIAAYCCTQNVIIK